MFFTDESADMVTVGDGSDRKVLESARTFVLDANANSKARLFMWKVKELKKAKLAREKK